MQNIHVLFKHFYTIHKEALTEKKKKVRVSTNTMHYDKSGNGHILCNAIFNLYNPPLRFGCWVVYKSKTGLFRQSSIVLISFRSCQQFPPAAASVSLYNLMTFLQKNGIKICSSKINTFEISPQMLIMLNTCVMHGMHGLVAAHRRLFGKYTYLSDDCTCTNKLSPKKPAFLNKDQE